MMKFKKLLGISHPDDETPAWADYDLSQNTLVITKHPVGGDLSCAPPIYRPKYASTYQKAHQHR